MKLRLIRSATLRLSYGGHELLVDPYFARRHTRPSFAGISANPLVDLPCTVAEIIDGVELILVSHLHSDHFDPEPLPSEIPVLCQPGDDAAIRDAGFSAVAAVDDAVAWGPLTVTRTPGQHGFGAVLEDMGPVSGFILSTPGEPTVYIAGDTVWYAAVAETIDRYRPDVIVTNSCGAIWKGEGPIVMDAEHTLQVCRAAPDSVVVAVHLDSLDHGVVSRDDLRRAAVREGIAAARLRVPVDGESIEF